MSHFLARLVERVRGNVSRAEPIIAPRFASAPITEISTEINAATPVPSRNKETVSHSEALTQKTVRQEIGSSRTEEVRREKPAGPPDSQTLLVPQKIFGTEQSEAIVRRIGPGEIIASPVNNGARPERVTATRRAPQPAPSIPPSKQAPRIVATGIENPDQAGTVRPTPRAFIQPNELHVEPPIVRITIGRIEVRATPAPAAPLRKSNPTAAPNLSLDTYLKERKEGRR